MKIYLSSYWRKSNLFVCVMIIFITIMSIYLLITGNSDDYKWIALFTGFYIGFFLFFLLKSYRFITYVKIFENGIESYLFNKKLGKVDYDKAIYYVIFQAKENTTTTKKYIAISNGIFEYFNVSVRLFPWDKKPFLGSYNVKKQIVMPYDEKTIPLLPIEEWHLIN